MNFGILFLRLLLNVEKVGFFGEKEIAKIIKDYLGLYMLDFFDKYRKRQSFSWKRQSSESG